MNARPHDVTEPPSSVVVDFSVGSVAFADSTAPKCVRPVEIFEGES